MNAPPSVPNFILVRSNSPRLAVMISSTSLDLPVHRKEVMDGILRQKHHPLAMEHGSAESDSNAIKYSLAMVDEADIYIGIFALRYGYIPNGPVANPDRLSVTELEFRRAVERGIPRLIFIAKNHPFEEDQIDFDPEKRAKLKKLTAELQTGICGFFKSPEELKTLVIQSLSNVRTDLGPGVGVAKPDKPSIPLPPELYAVPEYRLTNVFVGRSSELDRLDAWAGSGDSIMVVEGIGGLGKSAVTWEWMNRRAPAAIPDLAGRVWWGFYERGTSMVTFVRHALAYVTGQASEALTKDSSHYQRGQQLLRELRRKPYLLVLDGFERVLTAYHRLDKAQIPDDQVQADLCDCITQADGELLAQLMECAPSKILISTRLFPSVLEDRGSRKAARGVVHLHLNGLSPPDALELMRQSGVRGDERAMVDFAAQFGRHSLLLRIVCGMVAEYRRKPYDFDAWRADPIHGGGLKLIELDLKQRYTHILHFALRGLGDLTKKLLCRIAVISENATYDTLAVLNPFLPPDAEEGSSEYRQGVKAFDAALAELEDRGLLQWDHATTYEMHPVVRGYAAELLEAGDRTETFHKIRNHFAGLPPDDLEAATELAHVNHSLEIYRCLVGAGMLDEAAGFYRGELSRTLSFCIGAHTVVLELLKPLFRNDLHGMPDLASASDRSYILTDLANTYMELGRENDAVEVSLKKLRLDLEEEDWRKLVTGLQNISICFARLERRAERTAVLSLAHGLADVTEDEDGTTSAVLKRMVDAIEQGRFADGEALDTEFCRRPQPPVAFYRPGQLEHWRCTRRFYQGSLAEADWQAGYDLALRHRNIRIQYRSLALRAVWDLAEDRPQHALDAIDQALQITKKLGTPNPGYHDLRAWALARLGRTADSLAELRSGCRRLFAAETYLVLNDRDNARGCALAAYCWAWGEGPPYIRWYEMERSLALLAQLGEPEPRLPAFDPAKVPPFPLEGEIRAAIERLRAAREG